MLKRCSQFFVLSLVLILLTVSITSAQNQQPHYAVVAWSPDGRFIAEGGQNGLLRLWDATTGEIIRTFQGASGTVNSIDWSPDSTKIVTGGDDFVVKVWEVVTTHNIASLEGYDASVYSVAWSPNGQYLASVSLVETWSLWIWDALSYEVVNTFYAGYSGTVAWRPNGTHVVVSNYTAGTLIINPFCDIRPQRMWYYSFGESDLTTSVAWSPNGTKLAIASGSSNRIGIWLVNSEEQIITLDGHTDEITSLTWAAENDFIASASLDGTVRIWKADSGQQIQLIQLRHPLYSVDFSPDGTQFVYSPSPVPTPTQQSGRR
jgi:WD40 repeat protein